VTLSYYAKGPLVHVMYRGNQDLVYHWPPHHEYRSLWMASRIEDQPITCVECLAFVCAPPTLVR
jgi:hypothetical protein